MINAGFSKEEIVRLCETTIESPAKGTLSKEKGLEEQPASAPPVASPVPAPTPPQEKQPTIAASHPTPGRSGDPAAGKASCMVLEPPPVHNYEQYRQQYGNITATWSGSCVNGLAQGIGTLTWHNEELPFFTEEFTGTNGLVMNAGRAAASDAVNEHAVTWKAANCPRHASGDYRSATGQVVSTNLNLGFSVVASKLLQFGERFVSRNCPSNKRDRISISLLHGNQYKFTGTIVVCGTTGEDGSFDNPPLRGRCGRSGVSGHHNDLLDRRFASVEMAWRAAAQRRRQEAARQQGMQSAQESRQRYDEFTQRARIDMWLPSADVLQVNPFLYEGKVVGVVTRFEQMLTKDRGLFGDGLLVSSIPPGRLQQPAHLLFAGRVLGKEPVETPYGGRILMPHLKYEDIYICKVNSPNICDDMLLWQRRQ